MNTIIKTNQLTKKYGQYNAVDNVDFTLNKGEIYGLIGKNGAGKSTLIKMLMGVAHSNEGSIEINGKTSNQDLDKERNNIGFMMEASFYPYLNAFDNLSYFARLKGITDKQEIKRALNLVELDNVKKPFKAFSMGMRQRLALANALVGNPEVIVLDEPINGLDPEGIVEIRNLIMKLNKENNQTFVVSSHILSELSLMATKFGFIEKGVLLKEMSNKELHEQTQKALVIKTDDSAKTLELLKEQYPQITINDKDEVLINEFDTNDVDKIAKKLIENDQKLYKLNPLETTLEEYFIKLIGGVKNA